jgi:hypothetical protein
MSITFDGLPASQAGKHIAMSTPPFVADFDSSTGLVRALAASLHHQPFVRLGRSRAEATAVVASRALPRVVRRRAFAIAGGREAIHPAALTSVDPEEFARWVVDQYGPRRVPAVAIGSSNGAMIHLCAALGIPWLPQTFLVPVRRNSDPDDCVRDTTLAAGEAAALLEREPGLQIHQMHDPNQDRLMVTRLGYFRMKLRALPDAYRKYLEAVLEPGGMLIVVDCGLTWRRTQLRERHVYQHGAVGGLRPEEYDEGGPRVAGFLAEQAAAATAWQFPPVDGCSPEAEWGFESALRCDVGKFAQSAGHRVCALTFPDPESLSSVVADTYRAWYAELDETADRLLAETFLCVEPTWALATRTVPLWLSFGTEPALARLDRYLEDRSGDFDQLLVTLFPHGVRSAGYAAADRWVTTGEHHRLPTRLVGVDARKWPADFASLVRYSNELHRIDARRDAPPTMPIDFAVEQLCRLGPSAGVTWQEQ